MLVMVFKSHDCWFSQINLDSVFYSFGKFHWFPTIRLARYGSLYRCEEKLG